MSEKTYNLEERTARFGESVIELCLSLHETSLTRPLISQLVRAATSVGANFCEADDAETPRDFRHKIGLCRKGSRETKHWCRMMTKAVPTLRDPLVVIWKEADELNRIFSKIFRTTQINKEP